MAHLLNIVILKHIFIDCRPQVSEFFGYLLTCEEFGGSCHGTVNCYACKSGNNSSWFTNFFSDLPAPEVLKALPAHLASTCDNKIGAPIVDKSEGIMQLKG